MDIGDHSFCRVKKDDTLAVRLFDHDCQVRYISYDGIRSGRLFRLLRANLAQNEHFPPVHLVHKDQMPGAHRLFNNL
jgi:hypothetical protein